jgi:CRISPR/Cas system-associated protein endoribonuclease Cas2
MKQQYLANHTNRLVRLFDLPTETARVQRAYLHLQNKNKLEFRWQQIYWVGEQI